MSVSEVELLLTPCTDREHLQFWLQHFLGFTLPDCKVTDFEVPGIEDSTPLDFVWEIYSAMMEGRALHIMGLSGRDSGKTLALSIVDLLSILHDQRSAVHLGMTKQQATRAREYLEKYILKNALMRSAVVKQNTTEMRLVVNGHEVGLELLPCVPKAVQGSHKALVSYDEVASSTDPLHIKAYRDSSGIPGSDVISGKPAIIVKITSRQSGFTLAEQEIKNAQSSRIKVLKWTTIDSMHRCEDKRSGKKKVPLYINIIKGLRYTEEEWKDIPEKSREGFKRVTTTLEGCLKCPLCIYCQGRSKNQTSKSAILRTVDDVITKVTSAGSHEWILSQLLSMQPSSEGLVYFEFNRLIHIPGWNKMWQYLTGIDPQGEVTREMFVERLKRMGATFIAGMDFGWSNPSTCVVMAIDKKDHVYVLEAFGKTFTNDPEWIDLVKSMLQEKYNIDMYIPDPENQSALSIMRQNDLPVAEVDKGPGSVKAGINVVKRFLRIPGTNKDTKFSIAPDIGLSVNGVPGLVDEFELYKKDTDITGKILDDANPKKGNDHFCDALRYPLFWYFGKAVGQALFADIAQKPQFDQNNPEMLQLARLQGVSVNDNRHEVDKDGNPIKSDDPKDPQGPNSGGMKFAFT